MLKPGPSALPESVLEPQVAQPSKPEYSIFLSRMPIEIAKIYGTRATNARVTALGN